MSSVSLVPQRNARASRFISTFYPLTILALIIVAGASPVLVLLDRWVGNTKVSDFFNRWWCETQFLCTSAWRPYFLLIFGCTVAVIVLVFAIGVEPMDWLQERAEGSKASIPPLVQHWAGMGLIVLGILGMIITASDLFHHGGIVSWKYSLICISYLLGFFLYTTSFSALGHVLRRYWRLILAYGIGFVAVSWTLFSYLGRHEVSIFLLLLVVTSILIVYQLRQQLNPSYWLFLLALILFSLRLNAWYYAFIGDEYAFYDWANAIAQQKSLLEIGNNLFNGTAVYANQPYLSSLLQAISIKIFDNLNFGWRFSSILASALSIVFFYSFFRTFMVRWVAFSAAYFIAISHYLISFSRIGYNNTQALLAMSVAFATAGWAIRSHNRFAFVTCGAALAFCFYVFPSALYVPPLVLWLLVWYCPPWRKNARLDWLIMIGTALLLLLSLFSQPGYWETKRGGIISLGSAEPLSSGAILQHMLTQFGYAFYSFLYLVDQSHYVTVAYVDAVTGLLLLIGLGVLLRRSHKDKFAFVTLSIWGMLLVLVGASHQYPFPPTTRMMLFIPWYGMVAAVGLQWLSLHVHIPKNRSWLAPATLVVLFSLILVLNLYQAYRVSADNRRHDTNFESLFVRTGQAVVMQTEGMPHALMLVYDPSRHDISMLRRILQIEYLPIQVREAIPANLTSEEMRRKLGASDQVVIFSPFLDVSVRSAYESFLGSINQQRCQLTLGNQSIDVWYRTDTSSPCEEPSSKPFIQFPKPLDLLSIGLLLLYLERLPISRLLSSIRNKTRSLKNTWPLHASIHFENLMSSVKTSTPSYSNQQQVGLVIDFDLQIKVHPREHPTVQKVSGGISDPADNASEGPTLFEDTISTLADTRTEQKDNE